MKLKRILFLSIIVIVIISFILIFKKKDNLIDKLNYNGKSYVYLDISKGSFDYSFNASGYYDIEMIHKINHDKWDLIYLEGDLFIYEKQLKEAQRYYSNDDNFNWSILVEEDENEEEFTIELSDSEIKYLYNIENTIKEDTILFDEIQKFGTIKKVSKDGTIYGIICLAYFNDYWYYRTFTIDITNESDPEYVIKLPQTLNDKINNLIYVGDKND